MLEKDMGMENCMSRSRTLKIGEQYKKGWHKLYRRKGMRYWKEGGHGKELRCVKSVGEKIRHWGCGSIVKWSSCAENIGRRGLGGLEGSIRCML